MTALRDSRHRSLSDSSVAAVSDHRLWRWRLATTVLWLACGTLLCGCAGYRFGTQGLYPDYVRTVHVPVFQSESFRRDLGERLTEAVIKEIELKTPYKVVARERAETVLSGRIVDDTKQVIVENFTDDPRDLDIGMRVLVNWTNRAGQPVQPERALNLPAPLWQVSATSHLTPEVGQSLVTAQQAAIVRLAEEIVSTMEAAW